MLIISVIIYKRRPMVNMEMVVLTLFIVLYFVIDENLAQSNNFKIWYAVSTVSMYTYGYYINFDGLNIRERSKKIENIIKVIAISYTFYLLLTMVYSLIQGQFSISRNPLNIWTGTLRAATHYGTMSIIPLAFGLYMAITGMDKREKRLGIMLVLYTGMIAVMTASRTILLLIPIGTVIGYFANIKMQGVFTRRNINQLVGAILLIGFGFLSFALNLFNIRTIFLSSQMGVRYLSGNIPTLENDGRWEDLSFFFQHISESVWGGGYSRQHAGNLHNVYLNVFDLSGIIPFLLLVLFTYYTVKNFRRLGQKSSVDSPTRLLLLLVLSLSFIQMLIEPAMESVPVFMWCIFLICGMQKKVSRYLSEELVE